jgi:Glycosyltransferase family 92
LPEGMVTVLPWNFRTANARTGRALHTQALALAHAVSNFGGAYRWMATIDVDEFMVPMQHLSLGEALEQLSDCPVIALPWVMFGRNGHKTPPAGGVLRNFTSRPRDLRLNSTHGVYNTKPVFDATRITQVHVHRMRADGTRLMWNDEGESFKVWTSPKPQMQSNALIQLNHYYTRSDAELQEKLAKGGSFTNRDPWRADIVLRRVAAIETDVVEDRAILDFIARKDRATGEDFFATLTASGSARRS